MRMDKMYVSWEDLEHDYEVDEKFTENADAIIMSINLLN